MAIMVGCAPAIRSFWGRYVSKSSVDGTNKSSEAIYDHNPNGDTPRRTGREGNNEFIDTVRQSGAYIRMESR